MSETKEKRATFTPGPWEVGNYNYIMSKTGEFSVAVTTDLPGQNEKEAQANARLIAAAPEMHAQCKLFERAIVELVKRAKNCAYAEQTVLDLEELGIDKEKLREILAQVAGGEG